MPPRLQRRAPPGKPDLTVESPYAPITIPPAVCLLGHLAAIRPRCSPFPHQRMNIPQPEHGGNGESVGVVNQSLLLRR